MTRRERFVYLLMLVLVASMVYLGVEQVRYGIERKNATFSVYDQLRQWCEEGHSTLTFTDSEQILTVNSDDQCFIRALRDFCPSTSGKRVPNLVHYNWFGMKNFTFYQLVSFLSVHKFQKPCVILVHGDSVPAGPYWKYLVRNVPNIIHVKMDPPQQAGNGRILTTLVHKGDFARLMVLKEHGGIYLDLDTVLLRSLDPLMNFPVTLSLEYETNLWNGLIVAERNALFIQEWLTRFNKQYYYDSNNFFEYSLFMPTRIAKQHPSWIHVERMTFCTPAGNNLNKIFKENFDWKKNYAMHLYMRYYKVNDDFTSVRKLNATIGALARYVLYGTKDLMED